MKQQSAVIGSGVGGIASAIRLAAKGYEVTVYEKNGQPGGKLSERHHDGFRFDMGPSLFTLPGMVTELFALCGKDPKPYFSYRSLDSSCRYFWEDGTVVNAWRDTEKFAAEVEKATGVPAKKIGQFLQRSRQLYEITGNVFIFSSIHKRRNYLRPAYRNALLNLHKLDAFVTMHKKNSRWFNDPRIVQLFDRYATYNGSDPYKTPATLNIIPHLEHNVGAFFPEKGMYHIVTALCDLAKEMGVRFRYNAPVGEVVVEKGRATAIRVDGKTIPYDIIVSNADIVNLYRDLLPAHPVPGKQLSLQRSTSAMIFYWGIDRQFPGMSLHNILFSRNYKEEFHHLFSRKTITGDPTVYVFISSRAVTGDAPPGCENWYVMINAPENTGQDWDGMVRKARSDIIAKIGRCLQTDISRHIVSESFADPRYIETQTGSYRGSLYGLSSNSRFSAFYRHPNSKKSIKNLFFTGGSVHPGGGIPLCLASAKIVDCEIPDAATPAGTGNDQLA